MCELGWKSLGVLELTALPSIDEERWVPLVRETDVLLVAGGDALYLCHWMRQSGLADLLPSLRETVWVGLSAGSMVMTPCIGEDFVGWKPPTGGDRALGIVDFSIFPHVDHEDLPDNSMANAERWAAGIPNPAYAIDDQTAIKVTDGTVEVVSEGHWKLFTPARKQANRPEVAPDSSGQRRASTRRCGRDACTPAQQQGRRWPSSNSSCVRRMRRTRVCRLLGILDPADELVARQGRDVPSDALSAGALADKHLAQARADSPTTPPGARWARSCTGRVVTRQLPAGEQDTTYAPAFSCSTSASSSTISYAVVGREKPFRCRSLSSVESDEMLDASVHTLADEHLPASAASQRRAARFVTVPIAA